MADPPAEHAGSSSSPPTRWLGADWPKDEAAAADERTTLIAFLTYQRSVLTRKVEGLNDEQARMATCPPSDLTMLGLVRHLADVERSWSQRSMMGAAAGPIYYGPAHPDGDEDGDFHPPPDATVADAIATYWAEIDAADSIYDAASLDDLERSDRGMYSLRWIFIHLLEEYARHCGHADLIRQAIDGTTGD
ncbi:MAG: DinB family protein [Actinomycetota bacterium]|nr:DinB family protein [Actinomycetota bacterium]